MMANRAIYHDGWIASVFHGRAPWLMTPASFDKEKWELYDLSADYSQANDIASKQPKKLAELRELFDVEAKKHHVFPLDDRGFNRVDRASRPEVVGDRVHFTYYPGAIGSRSPARPIRKTNRSRSRRSLPFHKRVSMGSSLQSAESLPAGRYT